MLSAAALSLIVSVALGQSGAPTRLGTTPLDDAREVRVQKLGKQFRCAVCQGVSIADSPASMARAQLDKVRELVGEGQSDEEIAKFFVDRYGEWVLMEPRKAGAALWLWVLPAVLVVGGVVLIIRAARSPSPFEGVPPAPKLLPQELEELVRHVRSDVEK